jgi:hypothetical protein
MDGDLQPFQKIFPKFLLGDCPPFFYPQTLYKGGYGGEGDPPPTGAGGCYRVFWGRVPPFETFSEPAPPVIGYKGGCHSVMLITLFFYMESFTGGFGGFGNVKKKRYLCSVVMIQFSYGRGTGCFVGRSKWTCFKKNLTGFLFGPFPKKPYLCIYELQNQDSRH